MLPVKFRRALGRHFDKGLDMLLVAIGFTLLVGAIFGELRTSALRLTVTLVVTLSILFTASILYSLYN